MLGRRTAGAHAAPRRWLQRWLGSPSIHVRQKWSALWPHLAVLPESGLAVLDAGCGRGDWTLELAARRPGWRLVGLDRDEAQRGAGETAASRLGLANVEWVTRDFFAFDPDAPFDVVLSVASAHYAARDGMGDALFRRFRGWTRPGGRLLLLVPRTESEVPFVRSLARRDWHPVFSAAELAALCRQTGYEVENLRAVVGPVGTAAKQLDWTLADRAGALHAPMQLAPLLVAMLEASPRSGDFARSAYWVLVARAV